MSQVQQRSDSSERLPGSSAFDIVDRLASARNAVDVRVSNVADTALVTKCESMLLAYDAVFKQARGLCANVEQMKGLTKGLLLAKSFVKGNTEVLKSKFPDEEQKELLKFGISVVASCGVTVNDGWRQQREEMVKIIGKFDGAANSALLILGQISGFIDNYERLLEEEKELSIDPFRSEDDIELAPGAADVSQDENTAQDATDVEPVQGKKRRKKKSKRTVGK